MPAPLFLSSGFRPSIMEGHDFNPNPQMPHFIEHPAPGIHSIYSQGIDTSSFYFIDRKTEAQGGRAWCLRPGSKRAELDESLGPSS